MDEDDELLDAFFGLSPVQKLMWNASRPLWHGIARADVFATAEGHVITELNCDTPTGEAEAVVLGRLLREGRPDLADPNEALPGRFGAMVDVLAEQLVDGKAPRTVGIVYPTEFTEDLSVIRLYRRWLEESGFEVVLGSPYNLGTEEGGDARDAVRPPGGRDPAPLQDGRVGRARQRVGRRDAAGRPAPGRAPPGRAARQRLPPHRDREPVRGGGAAEQADHGVHVGAHPPLLHPGPRPHRAPRARTRPAWRRCTASGCWPTARAGCSRAITARRARRW